MSFDTSSNPHLTHCCFLRSWQWLFLIEGVLACMVAFSFFFSPKNIDAVPGITQEERDAMHHALANAAKPTSSARAALLGALRNPAAAANPETPLDNPMDLFAQAANHGGLWRAAYAPRSVLGIAAVLGMFESRA